MLILHLTFPHKLFTPSHNLMQRLTTLSYRHLLPACTSCSLLTLSVQSAPLHRLPTLQYLCPFYHISLPQYLLLSLTFLCPPSLSVCLSLVEQIIPHVANVTLKRVSLHIAENVPLNAICNVLSEITQSNTFNTFKTLS